MIIIYNIYLLYIYIYELYKKYKIKNLHYITIIIYVWQYKMEHVNKIKITKTKKN